MKFDRLSTNWFFESVEMLFGYVRQELVDPLRNAARWIAFGLLGGLLMILGYMFVAIGALRLLLSDLVPLTMRQGLGVVAVVAVVVARFALGRRKRTT